LFLNNLTSPPLLFFMLGALAAVVRSDLEIPDQIAKFLSIYLLFAIGLKGGAALAESELQAEVWITLLGAVGLASIIPAAVFMVVRRRLSTADAAAVAATYGSISAVTFVATTSYLDSEGVAWGGHLVAAMALMESPAIVIGLLLYRLQTASGNGQRVDLGGLLHESFLNGSVFLIVGSLAVGWIAGPTGSAQLAPFAKELFVGVLCLFLLDMGIVAMRRLKDMRAATGTMKRPEMLIWGLLLPLVNAMLGAALARLLGLGEGDALLMVVLAASASYIAVPAAMRLALPEANPSIYLAMSLAVTFPFNLLIGIPLYHQVVRWLMA
jgi:hypothetical protein